MELSTKERQLMNGQLTGRHIMGKQSLREIAKELDISPANLSYMVNGKRPWRRVLY